MLTQLSSNLGINQSQIALTGDLFDRFDGSNQEVMEMFNYITALECDFCLGNHDIMLKNYINNSLDERLPYWETLEEMIECWTSKANGGLRVKESIDYIKENDLELFNRVKNFVNNQKVAIISDKYNIIISHSLLPNNIDYFMTPDETDIKNLLDKTPLSNKIWSSYSDLYNFICNDYLYDKYMPKCIYKYRYIIGHYSGVGIVKNKNLITVDTGAVNTGKLTGVIIDMGKEPMFIQYNIEGDSIRDVKPSRCPSILFDGAIDYYDLEREIQL